MTREQKEEEKRYVSLYFLNNFLKFDRKLYQVFGLRLERPLPLKGVIYFFTFGGIILIWYFIPILNRLINWMQPAVLIAIPILLAWLLVDIGSEGRSPFSFFKSFLYYYYRKSKKVVYVRTKAVKKPREHRFSKYTILSKTKTHSQKVKKKKEYVTFR
ncbi:MULTISPECIES: TcpE family conjugal transfer membrane protein [Oceanobacillus]|uniref:TcpE family conjugal transfer membrane protein n=1 Tax=Oceanobacillus TaxID=182709 RepID=UPI0005960976|nr:MULTISPECIES: TcpE family conjugal transfer membrane protein [Oceanobacillus]